MKAVGKYIVVDMIEEQVRTDSGILLSVSDSNLQRYRRGVVITPGSDVGAIKEGDEIYFDRTNSFTMIVNERKVTIIRESDVVIVSVPC